VPFGAQILAVVDTWAALTRPRPHRPAISDHEALAVLRQQAGLGRLPAKLLDALEPVVLSPPPAPGRFEHGNGGPQPGGEAEDPDDPSSRMHQRQTFAAQPALSL
jgi:hypothetical protein